MATKPVENALVKVAVGAYQKSVYSNSDGIGEVTLNLRRSEYETTSLLNAIVTKSGYAAAQANMSSLPPFDTARVNGIDIETIIEKRASASTFSVTPSYLSFTSAGGTKAVDVTCPDNTWTIYSSSGPITLSKAGNNTIDVICAGGATEATFYFTLRWYDPVAGWQYRSCNGYRAAQGSSISTITFSGRLIDADTGLPVVEKRRGAITLYSTLPDGSDLGVFVGETDDDGYFSMTVDMDSTEYDNHGVFAIWVNLNNYNDATKSIVTKPSFTDAINSGVSFGEVALSMSASVVVRFNGRVLKKDGTGLDGGFIIIAAGETIDDARNGNTIIAIHATSDSDGYFYALSDLISSTSWAKIKFMQVTEGWFAEGYKEITPIPSFADAAANGVNVGDIITTW